VDPESRLTKRFSPQPLRQNESALSGYLARSEKARDFIAFQKLAFDFLMHTAGVDDGNLPPSPPLCYAKLPEYILEALVEGLSIDSGLDLDVTPFDGAARQLATLFSSPGYVRSLMIRAKVIACFSTLAKDSRHRFEVWTHCRTTERLLAPLLEFFTSIQGNAANFHRADIATLLHQWLSIPAMQTLFTANAASAVSANFVSVLVDNAFF
jgi:hypothetical protein